MSVLSIDRVRVDPPEHLPVSHLSVSSLNAYARCPSSWRRKYIDHLPDRASGKMIRGSAAGAALNQHFGRQIETGTGMSTEELLEEFSAEWDGRTGSEEVDFGSDAPGQLKDAGARALAVYHRQFAPGIVPVSIEREFELRWEDCPFTFTGYFDLETADGAVGDFKTSGSRWSADKARAELQPTAYLAARRAEGNPATRFDYHTIIAAKTKPSAEIVPTPRSERQLDDLTARIFSIARTIEFRWLNDIWDGTGPDAAWLCRSCPARDECIWSRA